MRERLLKYFREKSPFRITTDILFYLLLLAILLPFSRKHVMTGMNRAIMMRPAILPDNRQIPLGKSDYQWMLTGLDGNALLLGSLQDRAVFLSFWATWCPPCRAELPDIQRLYERYGNRLAMVLATDEDPETLRAFLKDHNYTFPVYRFTSPPPGVFRSASIPTTFLITPDGKISVKKSGAARWDGKFFSAYLDRILE